MDDAYCGGGDTNEGLLSTIIPISTAAQAQVAAAIFMGDPRRIPGLSYNVGTCQASGVSLSYHSCRTDYVYASLAATPLPLLLIMLFVVRSAAGRLPVPLCC
jgi:hypothetical protein